MPHLLHRLFPRDMIKGLGPGVILCLVFFSPRVTAAQSSLPSTLSSASDLFMGEGSALIVGGNVVSSRRRALRRGQLVALEAAARTVEPHLDDVARRKLPAYLARVLRTYRVLEEKRELRRYHVRVEARIDLRRLRQFLGKGAAVGSVASEKKKREAIAFHLVVDTSPLGEAGEIQRLVQERLRAEFLSYGLRLGLAKPTAKAALFATPGATSRLDVRLTLGPAPGVRGLTALGARGSLSVALWDRGGGSSVASSCREWGWGPSSSVAFAKAAGRVLTCAVRWLHDILDRRYGELSTPAGSAAIVIRGLNALGRYHAISRLLEREGGRVHLRRIVGTEVTVSVSAPRRAAIVSALLRHHFDGFSLVREEERGGSAVILRLQTLPRVLKEGGSSVPEADPAS